MSFLLGGVALHLAVGLILAGLSIRVWRSQDSESLLARTLFPWNAHERCVGELASFSICGMCCDAGRGYMAAYALVMAVAWPIKFPTASLISWMVMRILNRRHS